VAATGQLTWINRRSGRRDSAGRPFVANALSWCSTNQPARTRLPAPRWRVVHWTAGGGRLVPGQPASSLRLAMGLTTILTTIWVCPQNLPQCRIPIYKESDVHGRARARCRCLGVKSHEFFVLPAATAMILPSLMISCCP
jgi:hypothetical protein